MKRSRWEWLAQFFRPRSRVKVKREQRDPKPLRTWLILGKPFTARTRSEARALAKKAMGFKGRLPRGVIIVERKS